MKTIYLTDNFNENGVIYAIPENLIKTLYTHDTYNEYGIKIDEYGAEDYSLHNSSCTELIEKCKMDVSRKFNIELDDFDIKDGEIDYQGSDDVNESEINEFIEKFEEENCNYTEVEGFNYHNGRNWQTITIKNEYDNNTSHSIIEDKELIAKLDKAIEESVFESENFGKKVYRGNGYIVTLNNQQGSWASFEIESEDNYTKEEISEF